MAPRRNPDIVVVVLSEHGGWGATAAAPFAAQVINAFVTKQRRVAGNLRAADSPQPPETTARPVTAVPTAISAPKPNGVPTASAVPTAKPGSPSASNSN